MKRKLKMPVKIFLCIFTFLIAIFVIYKIGCSRVNNNKDTINFTVESGDTYLSIAPVLKENNLIKSEFFYKIYIKIHHPKNLQAGTYKLSGSMNVKELVKTLGETAKSESIDLTFKEGINFKKVIEILTSNFSFTEEEIKTKLKDTNYLDKLIAKYWFLTDDIKNEDIYYSLEGYLFPDTYQFNIDSSIEDIFEIMLDNMNIKLKPYENDIKNRNIHEIMTMASIIELEASNSNDRKGVAGVFYNRLENNWTLGSDVTTYYGLQIDLSDRDLTQKELEEYNAYNTRSSKMAGKLPVSPICLPGIESIEAAIYPEQHDYFYFVADKNKNTYFSKSSSEHSKTIAKLKNEGLWYTY